MQGLRDLFNDKEKVEIDRAPLFMGTRHPTWFPLFYDQRRPIDYLVDEAVARISLQEGGETWLLGLKSRLLDQEDVNNASSGLAEIRAFGGLLECGFSVCPISRRDDATPDFTIDAGDGPITAEVFSKHQDKEQDDLFTAIHCQAGILPQGIAERSVRKVGERTLTTTIAVLTPGGRPDPDKPHDSVQANVISRICGIKQNEKQISKDRPALLIADFAHFGGPIGAGFLKCGQTAPIESGRGGVTSGAIWYAMYGWKGATIFEADSRKQVVMGHDGRFRLDGKKKSRISALLVVLAKGVVLLENPWAVNRLPDQARFALCRYPWFELPRSIADWHSGDADTQIAIQKRMIESMEANTA